MNRTIASGLVALLCGAALIGGCGSGGSGGLSTGSGSGTFSVALSDAPPGADVTAVNVTIDRVEANVNGAWTPITSVPKSFNFLDLVKNETILGSASLPAGQYTQVRLFPSSATVTDSTGTHNVTIPSGAQTGVKVNVDYTIGSNQVTTVLLDFNVARSLVKQGNGQYLLQPVIPAVVKVLSGTVTGTVTDGPNPLKGATVSAVYTAGDKYPVGTQVNTSTTGADGTFKIWALLPGTYTINVSHTDTTTGMTKAITATGIVVTANHNTDMGTLILH